MHFARVVAPHSTLWDFIAIAKLRIIDECELNLALRDMDGGSVIRNSKQSAREDFGSTCQWWLTCVESNSYCYSNSMIAFMSKAVSPFTQMAPWGATNKNDVITTWTNLLENCAKFRGGLGQSWKFKMANRPGISVSVGREILLN